VELKAATTEALEFSERRGVRPPTLFDVRDFDRLALLDRIVDALNGTDLERNSFYALTANVWSLFKAVLPDEGTEAFRQSSASLQAVAESMRSLAERPNVDDAQSKIEALLDASISGVAIPVPVRNANELDGLFNLSPIDFER